MSDADSGFEEPPPAEGADEFEFDRLLGIVGDGVVGAAGGLAGTAMATGVLLIASTLGVFEWGRMGLLARPIGLDAVLPEVTAGYLVFLANGMVPWPLVYASVKGYLPGGRDPVTGAVFGTVLWTGFVFAFYDGYAGTALVLYLGLTLVAHWAYGFGLGVVFEYLTTRPASIV